MHRWRIFVILALLSMSGASAVVGSETTGPEADSVRAEIMSYMYQGERLWLSWTIPGLRQALATCDTARLVAIKHFGAKDTSVASALCMMAKLQQHLGHLDASDSLALEAKSIWEERLGSNHPDLARALLVLADCHSWRGEYTASQDLYFHALDLLNDHRDTYRHVLIPLYNGLGLDLLWFETGSYLEAESLLVKARDMAEELYGTVGQPPGLPESNRRVVYSWWIGALHINLGSVYVKLNDSLRAESHLRKAIQTFRQELGSYQGNIGQAFNLLGQLREEQGRYEEASSCYDSALTIVQKVWPGSIIIPSALMNLSRVQLARGDTNQAIAFAKRAIEKEVEYSHQKARSVIQSHLPTLASLYYTAGESSQCLATLDHLIDYRRSFLEGAFAYASEEQKIGYYREHPVVNDLLLSFAQTEGSNEAITSALEMILHGKAYIIDALSAERSVAYCTENDRVSNALYSLSEVCGKIATLTIDGDRRLSSKELNDSLANFYQLKNELEMEISHLCSEYTSALARKEYTVDSVVNSLPRMSVLWEFVKYRPYDFQGTAAEDDGWGYPRYAAFAINSENKIEMIDLGEAGRIDSLVVAARAKLAEAPSTILREGEQQAEKDLAEITNEIYEHVFAPLSSTATDAGHILISPDGLLNLLPFEILVCPDGEYVVERYQISYLSSGRDLMKYRDEQGRTLDHALVFAAPDFESRPTVTEPSYVAMSVDEVSSMRMRGPSDRSECLMNLFDPLPAAQGEGEAVTDLLTTKSQCAVDYVYGSAASETRLKNTDTPLQILHLATHGYYCSMARFSAGAELVDNPLLYSGLVLAGANRMILGELDPEVDSDDGILTSLEASELNLTGTELVVLSACQSGVGTVENGEGVYGLRRAFQKAGACTIVMSLFDVPDATTVALMNNFYTNWLSGKPKATALHDASVAALQERRKTHGTAHPLYWGGFILVGDRN